MDYIEPLSIYISRSSLLGLGIDFVGSFVVVLQAGEKTILSLAVDGVYGTLPAEGSSALNEKSDCVDISNRAKL